MLLQDTGVKRKITKSMLDELGVVVTPKQAKRLIGKTVVFDSSVAESMSAAAGMRNAFFNPHPKFFMGGTSFGIASSERSVMRGGFRRSQLLHEFGHALTGTNTATTVASRFIPGLEYLNESRAWGFARKSGAGKTAMKIGLSTYAPKIPGQIIGGAIGLAVAARSYKLIRGAINEDKAKGKTAKLKDVLKRGAIGVAGVAAIPASMEAMAGLSTLAIGSPATGRITEHAGLPKASIAAVAVGLTAASYGAGALYGYLTPKKHSELSAQEKINRTWLPDLFLKSAPLNTTADFGRSLNPSNRAKKAWATRRRKYGKRGSRA